MAEPIFRLINISKTFPGVKALSGINFDLYPGEVHCICGENGAGKSTLIKIVTGYYRPDGGEIYFHGQKVDNLTVPKARTLGVETVYQERALADLQTLWRNIFLGRELSNKLGMLKIGEMKRETQRLMVESMEFTSSAVSPDAVIKTSRKNRHHQPITKN